ncbi:methylated-DNA--[protein]-cysteine S-methyltransferase [Wohlfahrtiimonas chitiniclastica]|uniref:methylated-DNA--[protein]-cysteine S-methyltransferase n=1 Tax=Wohlfahrtiimonas chitiniclastica TaxID=400946 RepID=UPI000B988C5E|nr:methylated-DNA--[protein]-cysteine S-methyltransferase [Wohlfahrtiimonas chitiniclastica]OYQ76572.1 cysteine methyltransferase [Wohlfahrtiimonas chitiniclastica]
MDLKYVYMESPLEQMVLCALGDRVCAVDFVEEDAFSSIQRMEKRHQMTAKAGNNAVLSQLMEELEEYFQKKRTNFTVPMVLSGTPFQQAVWQILLEIPYGQTISYKTEAVRYGNERAIRAIASANGKNPLSILVPCHRVIGSNGALVGYAGGLHRKEALLTLEQS